MTVEACLQSVSLFGMLSTESLAMLAEQGQVLTFQCGQVVCWEGEIADAMYAILAGEVRVFKRDADAQEVELNRQKAGECFGELALLDSRPRSATVACLTPCQLFKLEKAVFLHLLVQPATQSMAFSILSVLVERVRWVTEKYFHEQLAQRVLHAEMEAERHRALAYMVAGVAHELNTPLGLANTAIDMVHKRLHNDKLTEPLQNHQTALDLLADMTKASQLALRNIARAHQLVQNFKKISVNQLAAQYESVHLPDLVSEILDLFQLNARQAGLAIEVNDYLPATQKQWHGDPGHLTQVLTNFLFNIERYAYPEASGWCVEIGLRVAALHGAPAFVLSVQDYGAGIAPHHLPQIFEPFFTTGRHKGGTGLGLAIVHNIVTDAFRGKITVDSDLGSGTCFTVTFPQTVEP
ncbi:MAG: cyclic nucleotide-binding domain-containing protein [Caldilineaceae bacterium]|nr:cyclic nucleotide-binding domain-containing protein [Caldilineaceae bacterium]